MPSIPYFDAHCDTVSACLHGGLSLRENAGHLDLRRLGGFSRAAQVFAIFADAARFPEGELFSECRRQREFFARELAACADIAVPCRTAEEIRAANAGGRAAALLSVEGGELLDCEPGNLASAAAWGVRFVNITWNHANALSGSNREDTDRGLSARGRAFVREAEARGVIPDVSHLSDAGFWDLVEIAEGPVAATHSDARAV